MSTGPDGTVVIPSITTGINIDNTAITQPISGTSVFRQRIDIPGLTSTLGAIDQNILIELRVISQLLAIAFNIPDDLDAMRGDLIIQRDTQ